MTQKELANAIGVSPATISAKYRQIQNGMDLMPFDPDYTVESRLKNSPLVWLAELSDVIEYPGSTPVVRHGRGDHRDGG